MSSPRTKRSLSASSGSSDSRRIATVDPSTGQPISTSPEKSDAIRPPPSSSNRIESDMEQKITASPIASARGRTSPAPASSSHHNTTNSLDQRRRQTIIKIQAQIADLCKRDDNLVRTSLGADQRQSAREMLADCQDWIDSAGQNIARQLRRCESYTLPPLLSQWVATASAAKLEERRSKTNGQQQTQSEPHFTPSSTASPAAPIATTTTTNTQPTSAAAALAYVQRHIGSVGFSMANGHDLMSLPNDIRTRIGDHTNLLSKGSCLLIIAHSIGYRPLMTRQQDEQLVPLHVRIGSNGREAVQFVTCIRLKWKTFSWDHVIVERSLSWRPERAPAPTAPC